MSVAFRRESDDEHLEPKFELPIPPGANLVTARGLRLIRNKVEALQRDLEAASNEDACKPIARDLRYWRTRHATAQLTTLGSGDDVAFGRRVEILMNGEPRVLKIVGHDEADPANDRVAFTAPLARALIGSEVGDVIAFRADPIEIVAVAVIPDDETT